MGFYITFRIMKRVKALGKTYKAGPNTPQRQAGSKLARATLFTWRSMVLTGQGKTTVSRSAARVNQPGLNVGDQAPDCEVHSFGSLEPVKLSSCFRTGRLTLLNFGSYT